MPSVRGRAAGRAAQGGVQPRPGSGEQQPERDPKPWRRAPTNRRLNGAVLVRCVCGRWSSCRDCCEPCQTSSTGSRARTEGERANMDVKTPACPMCCH